MEAILNQERPRRLLLWAAIAVVGLLSLFPNINVLASEIGGYISEKLIDRSGVVSSSLVIGAGNPQIDVGMGPVVSTLLATDVYMGGGTHATLNGNLSDLNGFPEVDVWFEWGYGTSYGNTTTKQTVNVTGSYSADIIGYDPNEMIYYRFAGSTDGTTYGPARSFLVQDGALGYRLLWNVLLVIIALAIIVTVFLTGMTGGWVLALIAAIIGIIAFIFVQSTLLGMW